MPPVGPYAAEKDRIQFNKKNQNSQFIHHNPTPQTQARSQKKNLVVDTQLNGSPSSTFQNPQLQDFPQAFPSFSDPQQSKTAQLKQSISRNVIDDSPPRASEGKKTNEFDSLQIPVNKINKFNSQQQSINERMYRQQMPAELESNQADHHKNNINEQLLKIELKSTNFIDAHQQVKANNQNLNFNEKKHLELNYSYQNSIQHLKEIPSIIKVDGQTSPLEPSRNITQFDPQKQLHQYCQMTQNINGPSNQNSPKTNQRLFESPFKPKDSKSLSKQDDFFTNKNFKDLNLIQNQDVDLSKNDQPSHGENSINVNLDESPETVKMRKNLINWRSNEQEITDAYLTPNLNNRGKQVQQLFQSEENQLAQNVEQVHLPLINLSGSEQANVESTIQFKQTKFRNQMPQYSSSQHQKPNPEFKFPTSRPVRNLVKPKQNRNSVDYPNVDMPQLINPIQSSSQPPNLQSYQKPIISQHVMLHPHVHNGMNGIIQNDKQVFFDHQSNQNGKQQLLVTNQNSVLLSPIPKNISLQQLQGTSNSPLKAILSEGPKFGLGIGAGIGDISSPQTTIDNSQNFIPFSNQMIREATLKVNESPSKQLQSQFGNNKQTKNQKINGQTKNSVTITPQQNVQRFINVTPAPAFSERQNSIRDRDLIKKEELLGRKGTGIDGKIQAQVKSNFFNNMSSSPRSNHLPHSNLPNPAIMSVIVDDRNSGNQTKPFLHQDNYKMTNQTPKPNIRGGQLDSSVSKTRLRGQDVLRQNNKFVNYEQQNPYIRRPYIYQNKEQLQVSNQLIREQSQQQRPPRQLQNQENLTILDSSQKQQPSQPLYLNNQTQPSPIYINSPVIPSENQSPRVQQSSYQKGNISIVESNTGTSYLDRVKPALANQTKSQSKIFQGHPKVNKDKHVLPIRDYQTTETKTKDSNRWNHSPPVINFKSSFNGHNSGRNEQAHHQTNILVDFSSHIQTSSGIGHIGSQSPQPTVISQNKVQFGSQQPIIGTSPRSTLVEPNSIGPSDYPKIHQAKSPPNGPRGAGGHTALSQKKNTPGDVVAASHATAAGGSQVRQPSQGIGAHQFQLVSVPRPQNSHAIANDYNNTRNINRMILRKISQTQDNQGVDSSQIAHN